MKKINNIKFIGLYIILLLTAGALQASNSPERIVEEVTTQMLENLSTNTQNYKENPSELYQAVEKIVFPHFYLKKMTHYVLGENRKNASEEEIEAFGQEFKLLLLRSYASTLLSYSNQKIEFLEPKYSQKNPHKAAVPTQILMSNGSIIKVTYFMEKKDDHWLVFEVNVDGTGLLKSFRSDLSQELQKSGVNSVTKQLKLKNEQINS